MPLCLADTPAEHAAKLRIVREKIHAITQRVAQEQTSKDAVQHELRTLEASLNATYREIRNLDTEVKNRQIALMPLQAKQKKLSAELRTHKSQLARQARVAYKMGHQEQIRLLLNQTDSASLSRTLIYYQYFNKARLRLIEKVSQALFEIAQISEAIGLEARSLNALSEKKILAAAQLEANKLKRSKLLQSISQQIQSEGLKIQALRADEKRIQTLLQSLNDLLNDIPDAAHINRPFDRLKGKLAWPTAGSIVHRFGESRGSSDLVWQGVSIATQHGQDIHSVSHGRVVFADWLQGFGLIIIIDHQNGYMSLYAYNESLYKDTGDWVEHGDIIAKAGASGGLSSSMLYFEIRHQGTPVDPEKWLEPHADS